MLTQALGRLTVKVKIDGWTLIFRSFVEISLCLKELEDNPSRFFLMYRREVTDAVRAGVSRVFFE